MSREANVPFDEGMGSSELDRATETVKERAAELGSKVDRQRQNAARFIDKAATTLHSGIDSAAHLGEGLESGMKSTASYIRDHGFKDMGSDLMGICRRYPAQSLISAAVLGFFLGQVIRRRD